MRLRFAPILALLLPLTGCFSVDDWGAYWTKLTPDARLKGTWKKAFTQPSAPPGFRNDGPMEISERDGALELVTAGPDGTRQSLWPVKTLYAGRQTWLAVGRQEGVALGYRIEGRTLTFCIDNPTDFIKAKYPGARNIRLDSQAGATITLFDDTAFAVLRDFPLDDACSNSFIRYEKLP